MPEDTRGPGVASSTDPETSPTGHRPVVAVVVVAYGGTPLLSRCVEAILASERVTVEVYVIDNGSTDGTVASLIPSPYLRVITPGTNLGFAGGCNLGAAMVTSSTIAFVNPDAIVDSLALAVLANALEDKQVGIVMARLRLLDDPDLLNSSGGVVHFLGLGWASGFGLQADTVSTRSPVTGASGAAMAMSLALFRQLGGFAAPMFLYHEDLDLSLRVWLRGLRVEIVPEANVWHDYEFSRNPEKFYYLERNRWILVSSMYEYRTLIMLAPALFALEIGMVVMASLQGWLPQKLRGWKWLIQNRTWVLEHRREVQSLRVLSDREFAHLLTNRFDARQLGMPPSLRPVDWLLGQYWLLVKLNMAKPPRA